MSKEFDNTNRGAFFKNGKKETENHPDYTGTLNVEGVEYWVSGWKRKEGASDKAPLMSFSVKKKDQECKPVKKEVATKESNSAFDDDLPF